MSLTGVKTRPGGTFDADREFKDAGLVAENAAATVDDIARVINVGTGAFKAMMILDVSVLDIAASDEIYDIVVQGSTVAEFATDTAMVELASISLGDKAVKRTDCNKDDTTGRYKILFDNENNGTYYPYIRVYTVVTGTAATGINFTAWAAEIQ